MIRALPSTLLFLTPSPLKQATNDISEIQRGLDSPVIVDARSEREYAYGAIGGAQNHPLQGLPGTLLDMGVEIDEEVIVYRRGGSRSAQAMALLKQAGFQGF